MPFAFTPPHTATGRSSLVPPPPWHYAGQVLSVAFETDGDAASRLLPGGFGPATGRAFVHFCEWQATTDGSELLDPVYAQYREFFVVVEAVHPAVDGGALYCPFIYVDQDVSMVRGLLQGWPKKMGSVWMTRSYELDHPAAAPRRRGSRLGASLSVKDRRIAEAAATLTGEETAPIGFLAQPTLGLVAEPTLIGGPDPGRLTLVRASLSAKVSGPTHGADAYLRFLPSPRDELDLLQPRTVLGATLSTVGLTIAGVTAVATLAESRDTPAAGSR